MARHNEILNKFKDMLADGFNFENEAHKSMVRRHFQTVTWLIIKKNYNVVDCDWF